MVTEMQTLLAHVLNTSLERLATNKGTGDPALVAASHRHTAAVHLASRLGDVDTLRVLHGLRTGDFARAVASTTGGESALHPLTPLQQTCLVGGVDAFDFVRGHSPEEHMTKAENGSRSPLELAAASGSLVIVDRLIQAGVDPFIGSSKDTPIKIAAWLGHYEIVCRLHDEMAILEESHNPERLEEASDTQ